MKIKKGDTIIVTAGKDKGKRGKVERVYENPSRVLVLGLNIYKRHVKRRDEKNPGGIIDVPRPFPAGNVSLVCPKCKQATRIGYVFDKKSTKKRICKKCGNNL